jgi:hypothetical protein
MSHILNGIAVRKISVARARKRRIEKKLGTTQKNP